MTTTSLGTILNQQIEHKPLTWWIGPRSFKRLQPDVKGNWLDRVIVAVNMARIAWQLHSNGLCHSDFSGDNFLAHVANQHVVLIDLDSLVVPGVLPPEMLGTGDYMAPEIVMGRANPSSGAKPTIETDLHSLAVLIYQLLLMRHPLKGPKQYDADAEKDDLLALGQRALYIEDPDDRSNRPSDPFRGAWLLGDEVEGLLRRAFTAGLRNPGQRPLAAQWSDALLQPGRGRVVGWQNRTLHRWHVQTGYSASRPGDRAPMAEFHYKDRKWVLQNLAIPDLRVASNGRVWQVDIEGTLPLEHGQQLILSTGQSARLALVAMQRL